MMKEKLRWAKLFDIPIAEQSPPNFPPNTIQAQRALVAALLVKPDSWEEALATLFEAAWVHRQDVFTFDQIRPIFDRLFGEQATQEIMERASICRVPTPIANMLNQATSPAVKALLTKNTEEALQSGSFGLPWFIGR